MQPIPVESPTVQHPLTNASLKRIAWAYGCSPRGTPEERRLLELLIARIRAEDAGGS